MNIQTVTPARLAEMWDTMPIGDIMEVLGCTEEELVKLIDKSDI